MSIHAKISVAQKIHELTRSYTEQGFAVKAEPETRDLPFDLGGYVPDLLVEKGDQHLLVEVKSAGIPLSADRLQALAATIRQHAGWRFLLVTADDVAAGLLPDSVGELVSGQALTERARRAEHLLSLGETDAAFLMLWSALEALLRQHATQVALPIERLPTAALLDYLYSQGELTFEQFEQAQAALQVRNRLVHGYEATETSRETRPLHTLVADLLQEWQQTRNAA